MNTPQLAEALCNAQAVMAGARKDKENPFFKSKYADLTSVIDALRDPFADNGLSFTQTVEILDNGRMALRTRLMHVSGEHLDSVMLLPQTEKPHELGSGLTYFRRYALQSIAGLPCEDDDGNGATITDRARELKEKQEERRAKVEIISEQDWINLDNFLNGHDDLRDKLKQVCMVSDLRNITEQQLKVCRRYAKQWLEQNDEKSSADELDSDQPSSSDQ